MQHLSYDQFMAAIVSHYGKYPSELTEDIVLEYIMENCPENTLYDLFKKITRAYSNQYGKPPVQYQFDEVLFKKNNTVELEAKQAYKDISRYSTRYPVIFSDPRSQFAVEMMGGWSEFENYKTDDEEIHRNTFCKYFRQFADDPVDITPRELSGSGNYSKPQPPQLVGNQEQCLMIQQGKSRTLRLVTDLTNTIKERTAI